MRTANTILIAGTAILLVSCGRVSALKPEAGKSLPVAAHGAKEKSTAEQLIEPSTQARPGRTDELLKQSEDRADDKFDLPPE